MSENKTYTQMRNEFQNKLFTQIFPKIRHYEEERKSKKLLAILLTTILTILGIAFVIIAFYNFGREYTFKTCWLIAGFSFVVALSEIPFIKKKFENKIKDEIMPVVCSCFDGITWQQGHTDRTEEALENLDKIIFDSRLIIKKSNKIVLDDKFLGCHNDVKYEITEGEFSIVEGCGKSRREYTVFEGVVVKLEMNKNFTGNTIIDERGFSQDFKYIDFDKSDLTKTTMEDVEFNKKYDVYTDDEVEARYLITPSFMQRLKNMKVAFGADKVRCAFYKEYLLIGLFTSKDLFSICSLFEPIDDPKQFFTMYEEIVSIIKLIDHFKLDQKIGM